MTPTAGQRAAAGALFVKRHPPHSAPGKDAYPTTEHPSPTTEHLVIQCGCGYRWRYLARELFEGPRPTSVVSMDFKRGARRAAGSASAPPPDETAAPRSSPVRRRPA